MTTSSIFDNSGVKVEVITGLTKGQELLCIKTERSTSGLGLWSTEKYDSFEEGKTYKVDHLYQWDGVIVAYVLDEDGACCWATPNTFKLK